MCISTLGMCACNVIAYIYEWVNADGGEEFFRLTFCLSDFEFLYVIGKMLRVCCFFIQTRRLFVIYFFCIYYKSRSDTCYTRIYTAEGCDSILHIDVVQRHSVIFHARNCGVLGVQ